MLNHISMVGVLKNIDAKDKNVRYIEVKRNYKNEVGHYDCDCFPCMMWTKTYKNQLFSFNEGTLVALDGRLELINDKITIIIENITYLLSNEQNFNTRGS